jgi:hypothetical protein
MADMLPWNNNCPGHGTIIILSSNFQICKPMCTLLQSSHVPSLMGLESGIIEMQTHTSRAGNI